MKLNALIENDLKALRAENAALLAALRLMRSAFTAFRSKPVGAPNSQARMEQEQQIAAENTADAAMAIAVKERR